MSDQSKESPADKLKREKAEKAEQDALDAEKQRLADEAAKHEAGLKADAEALAKQQAADAEAAAQKAKADEELARQKALAGDDEGDGEDDGPDLSEAEAAHKLLSNIAIAYPLTTPDEHVVFGFGGQMFRLGHLRALFGLKRSR